MNKIYYVITWQINTVDKKRYSFIHLAEWLRIEIARYSKGPDICDIETEIIVPSIIPDNKNSLPVLLRTRFEADQFEDITSIPYEFSTRAIYAKRID